MVRLHEVKAQALVSREAASMFQWSLRPDVSRAPCRKQANCSQARNGSVYGLENGAIVDGLVRGEESKAGKSHQRYKHCADDDLIGTTFHDLIPWLIGGDKRS